MKNVFVNIVKKLRDQLVKALGVSYSNKLVEIIAHTSVSEDTVNNVKERLSFFLEGRDFRIQVLRKNQLPMVIHNPSVSIGFKNTTVLKRIFTKYFYDVDYEFNPHEAWQYHYLLTALDDTKYLDDARIRFKKFFNVLKSNSQLDKAYIFGTGSSLEKVIDMDWSDGYRVVSNTVVKDQEAWAHLNPHVITAGDAIYHFGIGNFARNFRSDLRARMSETDTIFIYPYFYHSFCLKVFAGFEDRLFPVKVGNHRDIFRSLAEDYSLPKLDNILPLLLLPLGCTFSKNVKLWGFDGRAPSDKDFWKNSDRHFYQADVAELKVLHPAFFNALIPKSKESSYVSAVHGDVLEDALVSAEENGFTFEMMHFSHTPVLAKRIRKEFK